MRLAAPAILGLALCAPSFVMAQEFYAGKNVSVLISHPAGGGYDLYARLYARHLSRHLPGGPTIVAQNMPGAAGVAMANHMATQAPRDGTTIGLGPGTLVTAVLFGTPGVRYDPRTLNWIGSLTTDVGVMVSWFNSPIRRVEDLRERELIVGGGGASDGTVTKPLAVNRILGLKVKVVPGYNGTAAIALAMERGETDGIGSWNYSSIVAGKPHWISEKKINILLQLSLDKHPDLPDVPTVLDVSRDDEQRNILKLVFAPSSIGRGIFAPPGVPEARVDVLRNAFASVLKDPNFELDAKKSNLDIEPLSGAEISKLIEELHQSDPELVRKAAAATIP
jgi:tripartite-type tricarboxylate transporter receptor subunit TctC